MTRYEGDEIKVLDAGYVRLVDYMGSDEAVVEAARMSTGRGFVSWEPYDKHPRGDLGLLEYLYSHRHMTPFECGGELMIEVQAPIFVFREWHRHRTFSFNEMSARYAQMPNIHYVPRVDRITAQSAANKQGSGEPLPANVTEMIVNGIAREQDEIYANYEGMLGGGVAREVARVNTPVSRYSRMRAKTDLRNWLAFLSLRMAPEAQWEIRQYAEAVAGIIRELWPRTYELFEEHDLCGVRLSQDESEELRAHLLDCETHLSSRLHKKLDL